ncbi:hypothetical protein NMY22_g17721 [Coprinellus aureogranulatus]|nr:hypothetical protein NMY22_g17721 [Coprinellus aureogranulatus]
MDFTRDDAQLPQQGVKERGGSSEHRDPSTGSHGPVTHIYNGTVHQVGHINTANFGVNNGEINHTSLTYNTSPSRSGDVNDLFSLLNPIPDASHTRNLNTSPPNSVCFPGTRQRVLADVRSWVDSSLKQPHILWIYGFAGCGKSAIAQEVARYFDAKSQLASAFFFFRGAGDRSRTSRFAATIAYQMARAIPSTAPYIQAALTKNPGLPLTTTSLTIQFDSLVYGPMKAIKWDRLVASLRKKPFLIVLDGLDECEDRAEIAEFIQHMIDFFSKNPGLPLRFVITSRVEKHIHKRLYDSDQVQLFNLACRTSNSDIAQALDFAIADEKSTRLFNCDKSWPSADDKAKLVKHIGGSFIFLTTIIKYLFDPDSKDGLTPMRRLPIIFSTKADFDDLYRAILGRWQHLSHFHEIVNTIALARVPLSVAQIAELLDLETVDVVNVLVNLHAVMQIPGDDWTPITLWHTSLRDFLTSEDRAGPFFAAPTHHMYIGRTCVRLADGPRTSAMRRYSRRYALEHLSKYLITCEGEDNSGGVLEGLQGHLNKPIFKVGPYTYRVNRSGPGAASLRLINHPEPLYVFALRHSFEPWGPNPALTPESQAQRQIDHLWAEYRRAAIDMVEATRGQDEPDRHVRSYSHGRVTNIYHGPVHQVGHIDNAHFGANYGTITQSSSGRGSSTTHPAGGTGLLSLLDPILDASHTRNLKYSPPNSVCLQGTRQAVLEDIRSWAKGELDPDEPRIMWIFGYAGCGKSAIAQSISKVLSLDRRLLACFFFFRGSGDRSNTHRFATTIAFQAASSFPALAPLIQEAATKNPGLLSTSTASVINQFRDLIYNPVDTIASALPGPLLIVLDGVDECEDHDEIAEFIEDLIEYLDQRPDTPLRVLITSRIEDHLHQRLHSSTQVKLLDLVDRTSDADIAAALDIEIEKRKRSRVLVCDKSWPSRDDRRNLVKHIGGSYIFMTTIVNLLFDTKIKDGRTPMERLPLVLSTRPDFDDLYRTILEPWKPLPYFQDILSTIVFAQEPISISQIAEILDVKVYKVVNVLINLHAIMQVPGDDRDPVTLWHTSLRDFLTSEDRAGPFFASPTHHQVIGSSCLRLLHSGTSHLREYSRLFAIRHLAFYSRTTFHILNLPRTFPGLLAYLQEPVFGDGRTALEIASRDGCWRLVRALVNAKANVNVRFKNTGDSNAVTALQMALMLEKSSMIRFLLENGADPNVSGPSDSRYATFPYSIPIIYASQRGDIKLVTLLLSYGANPNLQGLSFTLSLAEGC